MFGLGIRDGLFEANLRFGKADGQVEEIILQLIDVLRDIRVASAEHNEDVEAEKALAHPVYELDLRKQSWKMEGWIPSEDVRKHFCEHIETHEKGEAM